MANKIIWSPQAADSFEEIWKQISRDSQYYATVFAKKVNSIVKHIPEYPKSGRIVPEYNNENLREKIFQNYRIIYRIKNDTIEIVLIIHSARLLF